ncbi:uncharacterized protein [Callorhinus ursinus]|uniref:uncharacterized protein n=1 Tax=Callorhinus ursinus TaxID=34884 RepID=UPI003CD02F6A
MRSHHTRIHYFNRGLRNTYGLPSSMPGAWATSAGGRCARARAHVDALTSPARADLPPWRASPRPRHSSSLCTPLPLLLHPALQCRFKSAHLSRAAWPQARPARVLRRAPAVGCTRTLWLWLGLTWTRSPHDPRVDRRCGSHSDRSQEHSLAGRSSQPRAASLALGDPTPSISTMKEDLETLLALERANIIANYTQARPAGSPRDPWEDAELSRCRLTDHHGFRHNFSRRPGEPTSGRRCCGAGSTTGCAVSCGPSCSILKR